VAARDLGADRGRGIVGPGGFDQLGAQVQVAGVGDVAAAGAFAAGVLAGDQPAEHHERARRRLCCSQSAGESGDLPSHSRDHTGDLQAGLFGLADRGLGWCLVRFDLPAGELLRRHMVAAAHDEHPARASDERESQGSSQGELL
jgi:hypothetical protein